MMIPSRMLKIVPLGISGSYAMVKVFPAVYGFKKCVSLRRFAAG